MDLRLVLSDVMENPANPRSYSVFSERAVSGPHERNAKRTAVFWEFRAVSGNIISVAQRAFLARQLFVQQVGYLFFETSDFRPANLKSIRLAQDDQNAPHLKAKKEFIVLCNEA